MYKEILNYLLVLGALELANILTGIYNNCIVSELAFDWKVLFKGAVKWLLVCAAMFALGFAFAQVGDKLSVDALEYAPDVLLISTIGIYVVKLGKNIVEILGVANNSTTDEK